MTTSALGPIALLRPRRRITGVSAILLPYSRDGVIDWHGFSRHVARTAEAGLTPAVNMDTGYVNLLDDATRARALQHTRDAMAGRPFVAGAFVDDRPGDGFRRDPYLRQMEQIRANDATPIIFQSYGLTGQDDPGLLTSYAELGERGGPFLAFELGTMFAPFGKIYSIEVFRELLSVKQCLGIKHSSLRRDLEWQRLILRDQVRPDFQVFTGNDLAIDMVMYGSDYLLGLSTFAPDLFARRDALWATGDPAFYELNDRLQYLGFFAFRAPVPAYKHSAAMFLHLRGWIETPETHPRSPRRPETDREPLGDIARLLGIA